MGIETDGPTTIRKAVPTNLLRPQIIGMISCCVYCHLPLVARFHHLPSQIQLENSFGPPLAVSFEPEVEQFVAPEDFLIAGSHPQPDGVVTDVQHRRHHETSGVLARFGKRQAGIT